MAVVGVAVAQVGVGDGGDEGAKPPKQGLSIFPSREPNEAIWHLALE